MNNRVIEESKLDPISEYTVVIFQFLFGVKFPPTFKTYGLLMLAKELELNTGYY
jgi:hypothetical protein